MRVASEDTGLSAADTGGLRSKIFRYLLGTMVPGDGTLLDLGAGHCLFAMHARDAGYAVTAVDARSERVPDQETLGGVAFIQSDIREFDVAGFDVITILGLLYHLELEGQRELLERCNYGATVILETQVHDPAQIPEISKPWGERMITTEEGYEGVEFPENENPMASIGNPTSFWHTEPSLVRLIEAQGYESLLHVDPSYGSQYGQRKFFVLNL